MHVPRTRAPLRCLVRLLWLTAAFVTLVGCRNTSAGGVTIAVATPGAAQAAGGPASLTDLASATPMSSATPSPTPTPTPPPAPPVEVDPPAVGQGETMLVRVRGAGGGTIVVGGKPYPLLRAPDGAWAVVGLAIDARLGAATVIARAFDASGAPLPEASAAYSVVTVDRPVDYLTLTDEQGSVLTEEAGIREIQLRAQQFAVFDRAPRWDGMIARPIAGNPAVTTRFGQGRSINGGPIGGFHTGEDLAVDEGTPVTASAPGRVVFAGPMPIRGNSVVIDHGGGVMTGYHHLHDVAVFVGQAVTARMLVGHAGSTGLATGPHLHWELTIYGVNVDPETWTQRAFGP